MKLIINDTDVITKITEEAYYAKVVGEGDDAHLSECPQAEASHIFLPNENMAYMANMGTIVEVAKVPDGITAYNYKYEDGEFKINVKYRRQIIIEELEELDKIINRATEDLYEATGTTPYTDIGGAIEKKNELRAELAALPEE